MAGPTQTDLIVAILGASTALGGFVLVFLGLLVSAVQTHPGSMTRQVRDRFTRSGWTTFAVFVLSIASVGLAAIWLAVSGGPCLFWTCVSVFGLDLAVIVGVAGDATRRMIN